MLALAGRRGWIAPRRDIVTGFWRRSGMRIVRRPKAYLLASLTVLIILAGGARLLRDNYDDRKTLPDSADSSVGYAALARHFSMNSTIRQYLVIQSPNNLRGTGDSCHPQADGTTGKRDARHRNAPGHHPTPGRRFKRRQVRRFPTPTACSNSLVGTPDESGVDTTPEDVARTHHHHARTRLRHRHRRRKHRGQLPPARR